MNTSRLLVAILFAVTSITPNASAGLFGNRRCCSQQVCTPVPVVNCQVAAPIVHPMPVIENVIVPPVDSSCCQADQYVQQAPYAADSYVAELPYSGEVYSEGYAGEIPTGNAYATEDVYATEVVGEIVPQQGYIEQPYVGEYYAEGQVVAEGMPIMQDADASPVDSMADELKGKIAELEAKVKKLNEECENQKDALKDSEKLVSSQKNRSEEQFLKFTEASKLSLIHI